MLKLRDYQSTLLDHARAALRAVARILLVAPTGAGKTALSVFMMQSASNNGKRCLFLVHRKELLKQTSRALWKQKLEHGLIKSGRKTSRNPILVGLVGTVVRRLNEIAPPDLIIIDEAHRSMAETYKKILDAYPSARVIGLTATPERTDGKGLGELYGDLVETVTVADLIAMGYLCDYRLLAPPAVLNTDDVHTTAGDYNKKELAAATDKAKITGDAIEHYRKHALGKTCIVFCVTVEHSLHVAEMYNNAGIACEQLDGSHTEAQRDEVLARFASGATKVLTSVDLFLEGLDIPKIEVVQWLRKTKSIIIWRQGIGRGLRPHPDKDRLVILDHVGNSSHFGLPDDDYEWSLEGHTKRSRQAKEQEVSIKQCPSCYTVYRPSERVCPNCGTKAVKQRDILEEDGDLKEIDKEKARNQFKSQRGSARTLKDLVQLGKDRGFKSPDGWAAHVFAARTKQQVTPQLKQEARSYL